MQSKIRVFKFYNFKLCLNMVYEIGTPIKVNKLNI